MRSILSVIYGRHQVSNGFLYMAGFRTMSGYNLQIPFAEHPQLNYAHLKLFYFFRGKGLVVQVVLIGVFILLLLIVLHL